ncbi:hypothetical protein R1sor_003377 [Riccia sorocarpa]|uniref:Uncharacterized protein n=1 Tax=Riccia sorocarpa TaxID=122646 RepID=A0ABD3H4S9_9MARC
MFSSWRRNLQAGFSQCEEPADDVPFEFLFPAPSRRINVNQHPEVSPAACRSVLERTEGLEQENVNNEIRRSWENSDTNANFNSFSQSMSQAMAHAPTLPMFQPNPAYVSVSQNDTAAGADLMLDLELLDSAPTLTRPVNKRKAAGKRNAPVKRASKKADHVESLDSDDEEDGIDTSKDRWIDEHVHELIVLRTEMEAELFSRRESKEYKKYKADKRLLTISGNARHITCKYFDVIDDAYQNRANVKKIIHGDAHLSDNPAPLETQPGAITTPVQESGSRPVQSGGVVNVSPPLITRADRKDAKKNTADRLCGLISEIVQHSTTLAQTSENFLKSFDTHMTNLILKL